MSDNVPPGPNYPTFDDVNNQGYQSGGYNPNIPPTQQPPMQQPPYQPPMSGPYQPPMQTGPYQQPYPPVGAPYPSQPMPTAVPVPVPAPVVVPNPMCPRCNGTGMILGGHKCSCVGGSTKLHTVEKVEVGLGIAGAVLGVLGALSGPPHGPHGPHGPHW